MVFTNNPNEVHLNSIDLSLPQAELNVAIKRVVRDVMKINESASTPLWSIAADNAMSIIELCGGITNRLYLIEHLDAAGAKLIVRTFGNGTEMFINRHIENIVFAQLSLASFGPTFHGLFQGGRIEGFIPSNCLQPAQMKAVEVFPSVAKAVSDLHTFHIPEIRESNEQAWLWEKIKMFFKLIEGISFSDEVKAGQLAALQTASMRSELDYLSNMLSSIHSRLLLISPLDELSQGRLHAFEQVVCHNDLLSGNLLLHDDSKDSCHFLGPRRHVYLIDYEYAAYNFRAYDLANHFCEFGGFEFDIVNEFPGEEVRQAFIRSYLLGHLPAAQVTAAYTEGFQEVLLLLCLASHLFWGSWATVQAAYTSIDFDYIKYAALRFQGYFYHKQLFADLIDRLNKI